MYWESPEKAQPHIQPRDDSPGFPLRMLSSVISEKFDVLQTLHVWSAEQVARSLVGWVGVTPILTPSWAPTTTPSPRQAYVESGLKRHCRA